MKIFNNVDITKLKNGLSKTRNKLFNSITEVFTGKAQIEENTLEQIEEILITADIGYELADKIVERLRIKLRDEKDRSEVNVINTLKEELNGIFNPVSVAGNDLNILDQIPCIILIVGVNGVGKTTTIGKLAYNFKQTGAKVVVGAADTFRAAAGEQLDIWAERAGAEIFQKVPGSDPSSVAFETVKTALDRKFDVVLIDTAGRLHSKKNLMNELNRIKKAIGKVLPGAPHETYLVLDASVGQNALVQVNEFSKVTDISGLIITKLDGTAKGGTVFQIYNEQKIPIKYVCFGEKINDLQVFEPKTYVDAIFANNI